MKITRKQIRKLVTEMLDGYRGSTPDIQIVYDGFENQWDQTSYDFIINGQEVSTRPIETTNIDDVSYVIAELIASVLGLDYDNPAVEEHLDSVSLNFIMGNEKFKSDLMLARKYQDDYPGY